MERVVPILAVVALAFLPTIIRWRVARRTAANHARLFRDIAKDFGFRAVSIRGALRLSVAHHVTGRVNEREVHVLLHAARISEFVQYATPSLVIVVQGVPANVMVAPTAPRVPHFDVSETKLSYITPKTMRSLGLAPPNETPELTDGVQATGIDDRRRTPEAMGRIADGYGWIEGGRVSLSIPTARLSEDASTWVSDAVALADWV